MSKNKKNITPQTESFSKWYQDVVREADLAESSEVRGSGIVKPYGFKIWKLIKKQLESQIEATGAEDVYFPLLIPIANLEIEKKHIEGFSPELAVVTHGGGEELTNKLAIRPTSETAMYTSYAKWIQGYSDLPLRLDQWNNVMRWEKRPRAFLRWSEFLWQEGHSAFATKKEAIDEVWQMIGEYEKLYKYLAIPTFIGTKSEAEKFAGAEMTVSAEVMARDGKAIQAATSHYLGTNFAKAFGIKYSDKDGKSQFVHQNSWGLSWRSVGAVIMAHGDDNGLRLPPNVAPIQVVIVPIVKDNNAEEILSYCHKLDVQLKAFRTKIDERTDLNPGFKYNYWEVKGVPVRLEVGSKEVKTNEVSVFRRDTAERQNVATSEISSTVKKTLADVQDNLYQQAQEFASSHIHRIEDVSEIKEQVGFFEASWCESEESEKMLKEKYSITSRVLLTKDKESKPKNKQCFITKKEAKHDWLFAQSY